MNGLWSAAEAAAATGGRVSGDWVATGVSIDSRTIRPGDLFVALTDVRDGHDFVAAALAAGAAAALVARVPDGVAADAPLLLVDDVQAALEALGRAGRARSRARVVAVTGSAGKTSTKAMLGAALAEAGAVHLAEASYNNHWGVPLTLARLPQDADFAVIEIGMNHPGEIAPLARMARPHVAIITTIAPAHLEAFAGIGGIDAIAAEKATICAGIEPGGVAILPGDLPQTPVLLGAARSAGVQAVTFGEGADCAWRLMSLHVTPGASVGEGRAAGTPFLVKVAAEGRHFLRNALAVLAAAERLGVDQARALMALAAWSPPTGRGRREHVVLDAMIEGASFDLIDDAFNANPASMGAALAVLAEATPAGPGRRVAILGDMLELGPEEDVLHAALADAPAIGAIDIVHCVGPRMAALHAALPAGKRGEWAGSAAEMLPGLRHLVGPGDVVLVKGSKGSRVSRLVDGLRVLGKGRG
ncbi:MAG: UDP-N-acetylmuramoyl-tripeptide--D-alanyl-D-alanine ligase [Rubellimicrobium sp.]|nr:UDP-N-acetylmuramoyl-tripeptide--D-alanyl-D-alanine ligase [Rubellimicrobium sp.]